ncbi:MAG: hypothetical protein ACE15F_13610 [bacterium]
MAFVSEHEARRECGLCNFSQVPSDLLRRNLEKAHREILEQTTLTEESPVPDEVKRAEALLGVSHALRALAVSSTLTAQDWRTRNLRMDEPSRVQGLADLSRQLWRDAWDRLRPWLKTRAPGALLVTPGDE